MRPGLWWKQSWLLRAGCLDAVYGYMWSRLRACSERNSALPQSSSFLLPVFRIIEKNYSWAMAGLLQSSLHLFLPEKFTEYPLKVLKTDRLAQIIVHAYFQNFSLSPGWVWAVTAIMGISFFAPMEVGSRIAVVASTPDQHLDIHKYAVKALLLEQIHGFLALLGKSDDMAFVSNYPFDEKSDWGEVYSAKRIFSLLYRPWPRTCLVKIQNHHIPYSGWSCAASWLVTLNFCLLLFTTCSKDHQHTPKLNQILHFHHRIHI